MISLNPFWFRGGYSMSNLQNRQQDLQHVLILFGLEGGIVSNATFLISGFSVVLILFCLEGDIV